MRALPTWQARPVPVGGLPGCAGLRTGITPEGQKNAELGGSRGWAGGAGQEGSYLPPPSTDSGFPVFALPGWGTLGKELSPGIPAGKGVVVRPG